MLTHWHCADGELGQDAWKTKLASCRQPGAQIIVGDGVPGRPTPSGGVLDGFEPGLKHTNAGRKQACGKLANVPGGFGSVPVRCGSVEHGHAVSKGGFRPGHASSMGLPLVSARPLCHKNLH